MRYNVRYYQCVEVKYPEIIEAEDGIYSSYESARKEAMTYLREAIGLYQDELKFLQKCSTYEELMDDSYEDELDEDEDLEVEYL